LKIFHDNTCSRLSGLIGQTSFVYFHKCAQHLVSTTPLCFEVLVSRFAPVNGQARHTTPKHAGSRRYSRKFSLLRCSPPCTQQQRINTATMTGASLDTARWKDAEVVLLDIGKSHCCSRVRYRWYGTRTTATSLHPLSRCMQPRCLDFRRSRQSAMSSTRVEFLRSSGRYPRFCVRHYNSSLACLERACNRPFKSHKTC
jgi:hypothetical protein